MVWERKGMLRAETPELTLKQQRPQPDCFMLKTRNVLLRRQLRCARYTTARPTSGSSLIISRRVIGLFSASAAAVALWTLFGSEKSSNAPPTLAAGNFVPLRIISSSKCGTDHKMITLAVSPEQTPEIVPKDAIWSIYIKDDDIQVERPYTPLHGIDEKGQMVLWVKRYQTGEVSRWLMRKKPTTRFGSAVLL